MDIQKAVEHLLKNTEEIKKNYTTVVEVRHAIKDIPFPELEKFARDHHASIYTDKIECRAYVIYSPLINGKMDSDIWLYSTIVQIKPAEIIEL